MLIKSPCLNCPDRTLDCKFEGKCEKWAEFRAKVDERNENARIHNDWVSMRVDSIKRTKRRYNERHRY